MNNLIRKIIIILSMLFALALSGFFIYKAYQAYKIERIVQKSDIYIAFLKQIDTTVLALERERLLSALYIGFGGKIDFNQLSHAREKSDVLIKNLEKFLKKNSDIITPEIAPENMAKNLQYVRSRVDVVSSEYQDILFKYYQDEIIKPLLESSRSLTQRLWLVVPSYEKPLKAYTDLEIFRDNLSLEESFVAFLLSRSQKIVMHDLVLWESILSYQKMPSSLASDARQLQSKLSELRVAVLEGVKNADYAINVTSWLKNMDTIINHVNQSQQAIYLQLQKIDFKKAVSGDFILKTILAFTSFLGFIWLFFLLRYTKKSPGTASDNPNIHIKYSEDKKIEEKTNSIKDINKKVISKEPEKPIIKEEPIQLKTPVSATDDYLPLSNMQTTVPKIEPEKSIDFDSASVLPSKEVLRCEDKTFYALEEFKSIIKIFMIDADIKNIDFHYDIDPAIPEICIGDIDKIKQFLKIFMNYAIQVTPSKKPVVLKIENIAQKKFESAINFTIKDSGRFMDDDERRKIIRGVASHHVFLPDIVTHDKEKTNLSLASRLVSLLDGRLEIKSEQHKGTSFSVTINLKKFIATD